MTRSALALFVSSTLLLSACGGSSSSSTAVTPQPTNSAPTDITLSNSSVDENAAAAAVGELSATDADSGDSFTFSTANTDFKIDGSNLSLADGVAFNYEQATETTVEVTVTDAAGASYSKTLTIAVNDLLDTYDFDNKNGDGSSVSFSGQTARHVLISELNNYISSGLQSDLDDGTLVTRDDVLTKLNSFFRMTAEEYELAADTFAVTVVGNSKQGVLRDISSSHKDLVGKIAGNDATGQHKNWLTGDFAGWGATGSTTPEGLVDILFGLLADNADEYLNGGARLDPFGEDLNIIYVTSDGYDLKQLIQKFLLMSVAYSQAADDYLDSGEAGKGLDADNTANVDGKNYTALEHAYDEGFGYFGAARDYLDYTDNELAAKSGRDGWSSGYHDTDGDGEIDLLREFNFGQSVNAAKRDRGTASNSNPTDYTTQAMTAFLNGREIIASNGALTEAQMTELKAEVASAVDAWERSIVATVIHYINDTDADLAAIGTDAFSYADLTKHWGEMKGFGLGIQFNPMSPTTDAQFEQLHGLFADKLPLLTDEAAVTAYRADLMAARDLLEQIYSFDADNVANW